MCKCLGRTIAHTLILILLGAQYSDQAFDISSCLQLLNVWWPKEWYWNVSMIMRQLGLEFREENANHVRLVHDVQVLGRIKDEERGTP